MNEKSFVKFPKLSRYSREIIVTEKIDGTNAQIFITDDNQFLTGSRKRWIMPDNDNFGFSEWAHSHKEELMTLGPGRHFGEWWGAGIQRKYGLSEKHFSLFNTSLWSEDRPRCCDVVPVLWKGIFDDLNIEGIMNHLSQHGSYASPGFMHPEGIVVFHVAGNIGFKKTIEKDLTGKWDI